MSLLIEKIKRLDEFQRYQTQNFPIIRNELKTQTMKFLKLRQNYNESQCIFQKTHLIWKNILSLEISLSLS